MITPIVVMVANKITSTGSIGSSMALSSPYQMEAAFASPPA